jgi:cellulase/cellobiase CelA1
MPSATRVDNPYVGAVPFVNPDWSNKVATLASTKTGPLRTALQSVAGQPSFLWLDRIASINGSATSLGLAAYLDAALARQQTLGQQVVAQIVIYNLPNRDCAALASNGELSIAANGMMRYRSEYIDPLVAILQQGKYSSLRIAAVIEVDSIPNLITNLSIAKCTQAAGTGGYVEGISYALNRLSALPNVYSYLDAAHSGWLGWDNNRTGFTQRVTTLINGTTAGWRSIAGLVTNVSNYTPLEEPLLSSTQMANGQPLRSSNFYQWNPYFGELAFAQELRSVLVSLGAPARIGVIIDTARNGWGGSARPSASTGTSVEEVVTSGRIDRRLHRGNWCNQPGGVGERPRANPAPGIHAYVWVKPPGESDGTSQPTSGPNAEGKQHDPMCSPTYRGSSQANGGNLTGAIPNAPHAGEWFPAHLELLVGNAHPAL